MLCPKIFLNKNLLSPHRVSSTSRCVRASFWVCSSAVCRLYRGRAGGARHVHFSLGSHLDPWKCNVRSLKVQIITRALIRRSPYSSSCNSGTERTDYKTTHTIFAAQDCITNNCRVEWEQNRITKNTHRTSPSTSIGSLSAWMLSIAVLWATSLCRFMLLDRFRAAAPTLSSCSRSRSTWTNPVPS